MWHFQSQKSVRHTPLMSNGPFDMSNAINRLCVVHTKEEAKTVLLTPKWLCQKSAENGERIVGGVSDGRSSYDTRSIWSG